MNKANTMTVRKGSKRTYVPRSNAIHLTVYSPDGRPVPKSVLNQAAEVITDVALANGLLVGLAET